MFQKGAIGPSTRVWYAGMEQWKRVDQVEHIWNLLNAVPGAHALCLLYMRRQNCSLEHFNKLHG